MGAGKVFTKMQPSTQAYVDKKLTPLAFVGMWGELDDLINCRIYYFILDRIFFKITSATASPAMGQRYRQ